MTHLGYGRERFHYPQFGQMTFNRFEEIRAWQAARRLSRSVEKTINSSPLARDYRLREQMKAAVNSMMANIAEGHSRRSDREFVHFLFTGKASAAEFQSHLYAVYDKGYIDQDRFQDLFDQTEGYAKMVSSLISFLTRGARRSR